MLSQLSYSPARLPPLSHQPSTSGCRPNADSRTPLTVGLGRVELPTSRLSGVRSSQLSYRP